MLWIPVTTRNLECKKRNITALMSALLELIEEIHLGTDILTFPAFSSLQNSFFCSLCKPLFIRFFHFCSTTPALLFLSFPCCTWDPWQGSLHPCPFHVGRPIWPIQRLLYILITFKNNCMKRISKIFTFSWYSH